MTPEQALLLALHDAVRAGTQPQPYDAAAAARWHDAMQRAEQARQQIHPTREEPTNAG